ncbi:hypothetical protein GF340_01480 [Candidatus Peregrinibacteria bacterium]|nr:hypothetical protein [Candidatus Peregrinibacteria bacterium]
MRRVHRKKSSLDFILPFLILVSLGVIAVMGFQLWNNWGNQGKADAYFYVVDGRARILPYGQSEWDNAFSGTKLLIGDSLKTSPLGRVVMNFFNETIIRMDRDTAISLVDLSNDIDSEEIYLSLDNGSIWVAGIKSDGVKDSTYQVRTKNMLVTATGTVFAVESTDAQVVRVLDGDVNVDIYVKSGEDERIADSINVGVGQQLTLDDAAIKAFEENNSISVLSAISDEFKETEWYKWNIREDKAPTDFSVASGDFMLNEEDASGDVTDEDNDESEDEVDEDNDEDNNEDNDEEEQTEEESESLLSLEAPVISSPSFTVTDKSSFQISGTVQSGVAQVEVVHNGEGYMLGAFEKGDTSWSYNVNESFGNLVEGANTYTVYAYDEDGNRSEADTLIISYDKPDVEEETVDDETAAEELAAEEEPTTDVEEEDDPGISYGF